MDRTTNSRAFAPWAAALWTLLSPLPGASLAGPPASAPTAPTVAPATGTASAPTTQDALPLYREGLAHYNLAEYDRAIALFKRAYVISRAPELLYNIAQAYRLAGDCPLALRFYRSYAREAPRAGDRPSLQAVIADMERCVRRRPAAPRPGRVDAPARPASRAEPVATRRRWPALVLAGTGVAVAAAGGGLLGWARVEYNDMRQSGCAPACDSGRVDGARRVQTAGWVLVGVGTAAALGGLVTWVLARRSSDGPRPVRTASVVPLGGGAAVELRF